MYVYVCVRMYVFFKFFFGLMLTSVFINKLCISLIYIHFVFTRELFLTIWKTHSFSNVKNYINVFPIKHLSGTWIGSLPEHAFFFFLMHLFVLLVPGRKLLEGANVSWPTLVSSDGFQSVRAADLPLSTEALGSQKPVASGGWWEANAEGPPSRIQEQPLGEFFNCVPGWAILSETSHSALELRPSILYIVWLKNPPENQNQKLRFLE